MAGKRVAVLVSGGGTNLQALIDAQGRGDLGAGELTLVLSSSSDAYALTRARNSGIPTRVIERKGKKRETFTRLVLETLREYETDLVVFAGFMVILSPEFFAEFENRAINVHPALIPSFCGEGFYGLHVHEQVLQYGVKLTGATVHFANEVTDGGPIILQKAIDVRDDDTPETLQRRVMETCEWQLLPKAVRLFCDGKLRVEGRHVYIMEEHE
ncbi:MAG: phosphoribosylglycinamide formyltransferase [Clostridiales bacterium]|jgi:phosphoribosylglycinamide formyltransferase-1|nr:phosphoribosylglycinamide formyltransferase [Clostridiales bacterium]